MTVTTDDYVGPERRRLHGLRSWLDYRTFAMIGFTLVAAAVLYAVVASFRRADDAIHERDRDRVTATQRIDTLTREITRLTGASGDNRRTVDALEAQIAVLVDQVRRMGGEPVVIVRPGPQSSPQPSPSGSRSPAPRRPSPTTSPSTRSPTPSPSCVRVPLIGRCL